jgi:rhomboid protease GluP
MGIDDTAVRDLGLDLKRSPTSTELRLPTRIGCVNGVGLGFVGSIVLLLWAGAVWIAWTGPQRSIGLIIISSVIAITLLFLLRRVTRWLRYGADVTITPDQLVVKKHWTSGEPAIKLHLHRVQLEAGRREIVVAGGRSKTRIGSGLDPEARRSVVEFLTGVIAGHLNPEGGSPPDVAAPGDLAATSVVSTSDAGVATTMAPTGAPQESREADLLVLALCQRFRQVDVGQVHLSPDIPPAVLITALRTYLDLQDDEVLLGIVGVGYQGFPGAGCALTTKRIYWPGKEAISAGSRPPRCRSLDYGSLPETIGLAGSAIDLGEERRIGTVGSQPIRVALIAFLGAARSLARGESPALRIPEAERGAARWAWPRAVAVSAEARSLRAQLRTFESRSLVASRTVVTPAIVLACVAIFAAMVARGAPALKPGNTMMVDWGANFGPAVVFDHQGWRLFTCMFLHFGLIHLLANMYCLGTAGPLVERFFGHFGFAALYLLSGLGGSIASLCVHPTSISAGASGAIFGVFGGLLGFLAIRHRDVPTAVLRPMRGGALAFVGYNTIFALGVPGIDMAAHLGGLVVGFLCGLMLTAVTPARAREIGGLPLTLRRSAVLVILSALLAGLGLTGVDVARGRILADPQMGEALASQRAAREWNTFNAAAEPVLREFDRVEAGIDELVNSLEESNVSDATITRTLARLKGDCQGLETKVSNLPAENGEIQEIRKRLGLAQTFQLQTLASIEKSLATGDNGHLNGPRGVSASTAALVKEIQALEELRDAYFKAHGMRRVEKAP